MAQRFDELLVDGVHAMPLLQLDVERGQHVADQRQDDADDQTDQRCRA